MNVKYSSIKSKATKDWLRYCPGFKVWKPKNLLRLHGPIVMGVCLDALSDPHAYQPFFHMHSLMTEFDVISLDLKGPLFKDNGAYKQVTLRKHEAELEHVAKEFLTQYPFVTSMDLSYSQYVRIAANVLAGKHGPGRGYVPQIYRDIVLLACYCGQREFALAELDLFVEDLNGRADYAPLEGGTRQWHGYAESLLDKGALEQTVQAEKHKFKLEDFEDYGLLFDEPVRLFDLYQR